MTVRTGQREIAVLLPFTAGLLLVALPYVVPVGSITVVIDLVTLLVLGAVLPQRPWRTGGIAALPTIVGAVLRAAGESAAVVALAVLGSPLAAALFGLVVKGGALFLGPTSTKDAGELEEGGGRRWRPFATKAKRGRFLIVVTALVLLGSWALSNWGAQEADRMAALRASEIQAALSGRTPQSVHVEAMTGAFGDRSGLPGGPYQQATFGTNTFGATAEVSLRLQYRCIYVQLDGDGQVDTEIKNSQCGDS